MVDEIQKFNFEWAVKKMEELEYGDVTDWKEEFDLVFDKLAQGPMKGKSAHSIQWMALKIVILMDYVCGDWEITTDGEEEPRWMNIRLDFDYGS